MSSWTRAVAAAFVCGSNRSLIKRSAPSSGDTRWRRAAEASHVGERARARRHDHRGRMSAALRGARDSVRVRLAPLSLVRRRDGPTSGDDESWAQRRQRADASRGAPFAPYARPTARPPVACSLLLLASPHQRHESRPPTSDGSRRRCGSFRSDAAFLLVARIVSLPSSCILTATQNFDLLADSHLDTRYESRPSCRSTRSTNMLSR